MFDTSALIGAWVRTMPPDVFPSLWDEFDAMINAGLAVAPYEVLEELAAQDDDLHDWVEDREGTFIVPTGRAVMLGARDVLADHPHLTKTGTGRGRADPFVIALAAQRSWSVVTEEQGGSQAKPRIPFVCGALGVPCMGFLQVMREQGWTF